ncbi:MAG: hypothetical protein R2713_16225 [Ilumatobacteraceae bacterium]
MPPSPSASSYALPAKYGGEVTTRATELSATSCMSRASPTTIRSTTAAGWIVSSALTSGAWKRA